MIKALRIADYITLLNLLSGLLSIYFAFNNEFIIAAILILLGSLFDKLDGIFARVLKQESALGMQLDSLADLVTFGVAPSALITALFGAIWLSALSLLLPLAGALRLARFNITKKIFPKHFVGLPITMNGIIFPVLLFFKADEHVFGAVILVVSCLMISGIKIRKVL